MDVEERRNGSNGGGHLASDSASSSSSDSEDGADIQGRSAKADTATGSGFTRGGEPQYKPTKVGKKFVGRRSYINAK